jgi:hypothetical protein
MTPDNDYLLSLIFPGRDFGAIYTAVAGLQFTLKQMPPDDLKTTVGVLSRILAKQPHKQRRQSYFLHRKAADTLLDILTDTGQPAIAAAARQALFECLSRSDSTALRAAAEALGSLPVKLPALTAPVFDKDFSAITVSWPAFLDQIGEKPGNRFFWKGRNLVLPLPQTGRMLTIKTAVRPDDQPLLHAEGAWMDHLSNTWPRLCDRPDIFTIPQPVRIKGRYVFRLDGLPVTPVPDPGKSASRYATGFISHPDYFCYPNEYEPSRPLSNREIVAMLNNGAFILGKLASTGIIHTAPIPLFHNRVQRHRREDGGIYQWSRGGRLDRWLDSCRFPNIGKTGLRDFEHFIGFNDHSRKLYEYIGTHLFSLVLIAGSCFRNRDPSRVGLRPDGSPVDARDLFDPVLLKTAIDYIFYAYYQGFTGNRYSGKPPLDLDRLTGRLIEEMGVDRHMEEILRVAEQQVMTDREFFAFLSDRGFKTEEITGIKKGAADITILTGPHLGAFNSRISLPELTEFSAVTAAVCIADLFFQNRENA